MAKQIKTNLAYLRFHNGRLSQKAVSEATGLGQKTLSALETSASKGIEFNTLLKLCEFFHCKPGDLLLLEDEADEEPVTEEALNKARDLVARGLATALQAPAVSAEEIWAEFDAVRQRMKDASKSSKDRENRA
jgi:putative transcriptional regulator